jgi:hypothetical protein
MLVAFKKIGESPYKGLAMMPSMPVMLDKIQGQLRKFLWLKGLNTDHQSAPELQIFNPC